MESLKVVSCPTPAEYEKARPIPYGGPKVVGEMLVVGFVAVMLYAATSGVLWFPTLLVVLAVVTYATNHKECLWFKDYWDRNVRGYAEIWEVIPNTLNVEVRIIARTSAFNTHTGFYLPLGGWRHLGRVVLPPDRRPQNPFMIRRDFVGTHFMTLQNSHGEVLWFSSPLAVMEFLLRVSLDHAFWSSYLHEVLLERDKAWRELGKLQTNSFATLAEMRAQDTLLTVDGMLERTKRAIKSLEVVEVRVYLLSAILEHPSLPYAMQQQCRGKLVALEEILRKRKEAKEPLAGKGVASKK